MWESCYWKEDLIAHAKNLSPVSVPPRWSDRLAAKFEKDIIVSFFCIRKLFDEHKLSSVSKNHKATVYSSKTRGKPVTLLNKHRIEELYDFKNEITENKGIHFLTNQFIHSYIVFPYRNEDRNWGGIFVCSDYEKNNAILRIEIEEIRKILNIVGHDYPLMIKMTFDRKSKDYTLQTN